MNQQQQATVIWSRLPNLNIRRRHRTRRSDRLYKLHTSQVTIWAGFQQEVRQETASVFGNPVNFVQPSLATEHHIVATESGVSARIVQHISQAVGAVFEAQGLSLRFGDSPAGSSVAFGAYPDAMIENLQTPGRVLVVGEYKTPWARHLD